MRRPVDVPPARLGDGDAPHAQRGVGPAQDYACPIGTPVYAMFPVRRLAKTGGADTKGGHTLIGYADGRNYWVVQHLSAWQTSVSADGRVALSGNSGTDTTGPHVHSYVVVDGVRMNPERWLSQLAALNETPFNPEGFLMALTDEEQREILEFARGNLSSADQVKLFQNAQTARDRADGNLSSADQVKLFQNVQTIRDRLDTLVLERLSTLDTESVKAIAEASADELSRRLRE
jgi:hypothetical protein